jgi:hypothetical protein
MQIVGRPFWFLALSAILPLACGPTSVSTTGGDSGAVSTPDSAGSVDTGVPSPAADGTAPSQGGGDDAPADAATADELPQGDAPSAALAPDGSVGCKTAGTELCDGFESGRIDPKIWGMTATAGTSLTVDTLHAHSGMYALHVKVVPGQSNTAQIAEAVTFPVGNNAFYTRAFFYFSPDLPFDMMGGFHMALLLATGNNTLGYVEAGLASAGNKQYLGYSEYYGAGPDVHAHGPTFTEFGPRSTLQVVPMKWICLELMQRGDLAANPPVTSRRVWVDGKELPEQVSNYTMRPPPAFSHMSIGALQYHPTPILSDIWIDDVRVSSAPIGCDTLSQ